MTVVDPANIRVRIELTPQGGTAAQYASRFLARTVAHLKDAETHAHDDLVPQCLDRVAAALEAAGLSPASVVKLAAEIGREAHLLVAEAGADARKTLSTRMAADVAATLIPRLEKGAS